MDEKEEWSEFEEEEEEEFMFNANSNPQPNSVFKTENAVSIDVVNPLAEPAKTEIVEEVDVKTENAFNSDAKPESAEVANIKTERNDNFDAEPEVSEDPFEKLVGKDYVEIGAKDKNLESEKIPLVSNIAKDIRHPVIIQAHEHHLHNHAVKSEYEEVLHNQDLRFRSKKMVDKNAVYAGLVLAVVVILVVFLFFIKGENLAVSQDKEENESVTTEEPVAFLSIPIKYSFDKYLYPEDNNYNKEVSLICFLRKEIRSVGEDAQYIDYFVVDDYGNRIKLNFFRLNNPSSYEHLFMMNSTTKTLFNVSGSLRKEGYQELKLYVSNITGADREYEKRELN